MMVFYEGTLQSGWSLVVFIKVVSRDLFSGSLSSSFIKVVSRRLL